MIIQLFTSLAVINIYETIPAVVLRAGGFRVEFRPFPVKQ